MSDIAAEAGVSKNTVSLALRNDPQIPEKTRARIATIAKRLKYRKSPTVAHLMAELRRAQAPGFQSSLALLNANTDRDALRKHPTIPAYVKGCQKRTAELGYTLDEFWLHEPDLDGERLNAILRARGIRGLLVVGLMRENRLPERFRQTWQEFPAVVTGVRTQEPALSFACTDHHMLALKAIEHALALGYERPALVIDPVIDRLVDGRFSAGVYAAQSVLSAKQRIRSFLDIQDDRSTSTRFMEWYKRSKPDAILTLYNHVRGWLEGADVRVPRDVGLIQLEWRASSPEWAGMDQHNDVVGEAAVEMLVGMIHHNERGVPDFPRATLVGSTWVDGKTVR
ncbi:hypothetical protein BH09VER1_BH09VER1_55110 [soil metagenome]